MSSPLGAGCAASKGQLALLNRCAKKESHCLCTLQPENNQEAPLNSTAEFILRIFMEKNINVAIYITEGQCNKYRSFLLKTEIKIVFNIHSLVIKSCICTCASSLMFIRKVKISTSVIALLQWSIV